MIVRIWHGKTKQENAEAYRLYVLETGIKEYSKVKGNKGAQLWQNTEGDVTHIWTISWWENLEAVKLFAGENFEKPKYYQEDEKYLIELEPTVMHCEAFDL